MNIDTHDDSAGPWIQLGRDGGVVSVGRWPGPVGPGTTISSTDGGRFEFDHFDRCDGSRVAVYHWVRS